MQPKARLHNKGFWFVDKRRKSGLTQAALAEQVGVARAYITQIERGTKWPSKPRLYAILAALDVPMSEAVDTLGLVPNDETDRFLRFTELLEEIAPHVPATRLAEFREMFASESDSHRWLGQFVTDKPLPAAPDGWMRLQDEDRRLVQRVVHRILDGYPEEATDGDAEA